MNEGNLYPELAGKLAYLECRYSQLKQSVQSNLSYQHELDCQLENEKKETKRLIDTKEDLASQAKILEEYIEKLYQSVKDAENQHSDLLKQLTYEKEKNARWKAEQDENVDKYTRKLKSHIEEYNSFPLAKERNSLIAQVKAVHIECEVVKKKISEAKENANQIQKIKERREQIEIIKMAESYIKYRDELKRKEEIQSQISKLTDEINQVKEEKEAFLKKIGKPRKANEKSDRTGDFGASNKEFGQPSQTKLSSMLNFIKLKIAEFPETPNLKFSNFTYPFKKNRNLELDIINKNVTANNFSTLSIKSKIINSNKQHANIPISTQKIERCGEHSIVKDAESNNSGIIDTKINNRLINNVVEITKNEQPLTQDMFPNDDDSNIQPGKEECNKTILNELNQNLSNQEKNIVFEIDINQRNNPDLNKTIKSFLTQNLLKRHHEDDDNSNIRPKDMKTKHSNNIPQLTNTMKLDKTIQYGDIKISTGDKHLESIQNTQTYINQNVQVMKDSEVILENKEGGDYTTIQQSPPDLVPVSTQGSNICSPENLTPSDLDDVCKAKYMHYLQESLQYQIEPLTSTDSNQSTQQLEVGEKSHYFVNHETLGKEHIPEKNQESALPPPNLSFIMSPPYNINQSNRSFMFSPPKKNHDSALQPSNLFITSPPFNINQSSRPSILTPPGKY
uniref:Uncharacterized protein n=2 Tax=Clastoptera arizonana TaxID=38151 RepID=A0A1B6DGB5_9HEMI